MKKILALMLMVVMLFAITACGGEKGTVETLEAAQSSEHTAEVTTGKEDNSEEENTIPKTWEKSFYVDDFDEPTDEWFISTSFMGTFSNSATTDSSLSGYVLIDEENVSFILYEYNRSQVKNTYSRNKAYTITAKAEDGSTTEYSGCVWSQGDRVVVSDEDKAAIIELMKNGGKIKFYIYETDNSVTNYLFTVKSNNLKDLLQ